LLGQIILTNVFWFDPITTLLLNINRGALAYDVVGDNHSADTERPNVKKKLIGVRETHRLVFTVQAETWNMGKVLKKIG
jgi:hypothetical protein